LHGFRASELIILIRRLNIVRDQFLPSHEYSGSAPVARRASATGPLVKAQ